MKQNWTSILKKLFPLPIWAELPAFVLCGVALIWVFWKGLDAWLPAYFLYALSAYLLTSLCIKLPGLAADAKNWLHRHPTLSAMLKSRDLRFKMGLYREQFINFAYGIFKILAGVIIGSAWIGADGIYNFTQAMIQLFQILRRRKPGTIRDQWKSYRFCGVLMLLMHLTMTGIVFQMVNWNRTEEHGQIMIIATAAFAFYKLISSLIDLARDRKHAHPIDSSVRMLELSQAFFAMFSLQAGLLHTFGTGEKWENHMNLATGCVVCLLVVATGIYMIRRSNRELRKIQENENGE